ncbi:MAG TPA: SRPBCC family protein [Acidimicrobiales bacterium]|jgi:hypothetical protein|nr:SRPBCC family protein [Acidimicrobiales bacterium]
MALRNILVEASPSEVWEVLSDGHSYAEWVVGTRQIRSVDPNWPAEGSSLYYRIGIGPLTFEDFTTVRVADTERRLELEAHASPFGSIRISVQLLPWGDHCVVIVDEHPLRGPALFLRNPATDLALTLRNRVMLRRLASLVENRATDGSSHA